MILLEKKTFTVFNYLIHVHILSHFSFSLTLVHTETEYMYIQRQRQSTYRDRDTYRQSLELQKTKETFFSGWIRLIPFPLFDANFR